jgi:hypothetical protein
VQTIQVICTAHALATVGQRVELCVEGTGAPHEVLSRYGLGEVPGLTLRVLGRGTVASVLWRAAFAAFVARTRGRGVVLARKKRNAREALRIFGRRCSLVLEVHEVDSATGSEPDAWRALEAEVLAGSQAVIVNAEGTLEVLREVHPVLPPVCVSHNAARPAPPPRADGTGIGIVGSVRDDKDPHTVEAVAREVPGLVWVGADRTLDGVTVEPALDYRDVPARLAAFRTLLVPLSPGLFGERLTSPLKLWDALASGVPAVAADTAAVRSAAPGCFVPYTPGDPTSLAAALRRADTDGALRAAVVAEARRRARTWTTRADEIVRFVVGVLA